ncbi:MAG: MarR family transcriptional regulator [Alphaproteobacteria bacterium]|nr:MarR family transcriptional regulator [Alphaproteobacteria bacterium]
MARKEFVRLMEENIWTLDKIAEKLRLDRVDTTGYPRQLMSILVRLHNGGRAKLKDIARREHVSAPNLCAAFRKLEHDGLVIRAIDDEDRRNTWYCVSPSGAELAIRAMDLFRNGVERVFANLSKEDEKRLTDALRTMRDIIRKVELDNE